MKFKKSQFNYVVLTLPLLGIIFLAPIVSAACPADCGKGECNPAKSTCLCRLPWTGPNCTEREACVYTNEDGDWIRRNCHNHGTCVTINGAENIYKCDCEADYLGPDCAIPDPCKFNEKGIPWKEGSACFGGEECTPSLNDPPSFTCKCPEGKLRPRCRWADPCYSKDKKERVDHPCYSNHRQKNCIVKWGPENHAPTKKCECNNIYFGDSCEFKNPCLFPKKKNDKSCLFDSTCVRVDDVKFTCTCKRPQDFGQFCDQHNLCKAPPYFPGCDTKRGECNPCENNGTCYWGGNDHYNCYCNTTNSSDYFGAWCHVQRSRAAIIPAGRNQTEWENDTLEVEAGREYTFYLIVLRHSFKYTTWYQVNASDGSPTVRLIKSNFRSVSELRDEKVMEAVNRIKLDREPVYFTFKWVYKVGDFNFEFRLREYQIYTQPYKIHRLKIISKLAPGLDCIPTTKLTDVSHSTKDPIEYSRNDHFTVNAAINDDCLIGKEVFHEWKLYRLTQTFPAQGRENDWHLEDLVPEATGKLIEFYHLVLVEGLYWIQCRAYIKVNEVKYGHSDLGFFRVFYLPPKIHLKEGTIRVADPTHEILLDATGSIDENFPEESEYLEYYWLCFEPCKHKIDPGSIAEIPANTFKNGETIRIYLRVKSRHAFNEASEVITIHMLDHAHLSVECIRNCEKYNPGVEVVFRCDYTLNDKEGPADHLHWSWYPPLEVFPIPVKDESYQVDVALPKVEDAEPREIICTAKPPGLELQSFTSSLRIQINLPPQLGECTVSPASGLFLETTFDIDCSRFHDVNAVLYSFYVEVSDGGEFTDDLQNRLLFGHGTNPEMENVFLPYGNLKIIVEATDDLDLSSEVSIPVQVTRPSDLEIRKLFENFIFKDDSIMRNKLLGGDLQAGLQLQMIALKVARDPQLLEKQIWTEVELDKLHSVAAVNLRSGVIATFKEMEQIIHSMHMLTQVEDRTDVGNFTNVSQILITAAAQLAELVHRPEEHSPDHETDVLVNATSDAADRLLRACANLSSQPVNHQPLPSSVVNIRDVADFVNTSDRDYFAGYRDDQKIFDEDGMNSVAESAEPLVQNYAKTCHFIIHALQHATDAAVVQLGYNHTFEWISPGSSIIGKVFPSNSSEANLTLTTPRGQVRLYIPKEDMQQIKNITNDLDVETQMIVIEVNPYVDDTSAQPETAIVQVEIKEPDTHNPIILKRTPVPLEIYMTFNKQVKKQLIEAGKSTMHQVAILPPSHITEWTYILSFKMNLPYNSKVDVQISDPSTPTMVFRILALKDRPPVLRDFCQYPTIENGSRGFSAVIETETIGLNEVPPEPYLEYFVGFLPFDPEHPHTTQTFSVVFTRPSCLHRNEDHKFWSEEGCMVKDVKVSNKKRPGRGPSKLEGITCLCNHLSTFAGTHFVIPHTIENNSVLTDFSVDEFVRNPIVVITVSILLFIYFVGFLICRYFDLLDERKSTGLTIMADLKDSLLDTYYLITVLTGVSLWAGTSSCVCMVMYGSNGRSQIYTLKDKNLTVFRRGALDTFLVPCNKDLGTLEKIRIWTDHSGHDPAWYCRKILIRHVASDQSWHFYLNQCLEVSAEKGSTVILEIPATTKDEQKKFSTRFSENLMEQFDNAMLWVSIFRYSPASSFTRCQRLSCAFAVLSSYLMLDIMAQGTETTDADALYDFGEYKIDLNNIIKGAQLVVFALPFGIIITGLFKNILPRYVPTLIIWKNVVPATTALERKRFFIPSVHGFSYSKNKSGWPSTKTVLFRQGDGDVEDDNDIESEDDDYEDQAILEGANIGRPVRETLSPSSSSTFSIPSTDIPLLEGWIQDRVQHDQGMETDDEEGDEYDLFVQNLDGAVEDERKRDADNLARLGRRAMTHAVREYDPNSFIFQGEHDVPSVEDLIDKRILEGRKQRQKDGVEDSEQEEDPFQPGAITIQPPPKKGKFRKLIDKLKKGKDTEPPPWKEVVTNEYLEEIDKSLEKETENRTMLQNKKNWEEQIALELCLLPQFNPPKCSWPWWFVYIAWFVCLTSIVGTSAFTVIFGLHYGFLRSSRWLENFVGSFFTSKFVVQPLTAFVVAFFATLLGKRHKIQERVQVLIEDSKNSAFLKSRKPYSFNIFRSFRTYGPLSGNQIFRLLIEARRRKELRGKLFRLTICILLLAPLIAYSYSGHNTYNYGVTRNIRNMFNLNKMGERDGKIVFNNLHEMYQYVKRVLESIHPEDALDTRGHHRAHTDRGGSIPHIAFIEDHQSVLIGVLRLRQQRIKPSECEVGSEELGQQDHVDEHHHHECVRNKGFSSSTQDRASYNPLWKPVINGVRHKASESNDGWEFHGEDSNKIRSLSFTGHQGRYDGGGYIFEFARSRLLSLHVMDHVNDTNWLDHRTRALFIEFTLFNPNINKFADVVLLIEQGPTWSYSMISWITPIELIPLEEFSRKSDEAAWLMLSFILIVLVLIVMIFMFVHDLCTGHKRQPLLSLNFWLDLTIIIFVTASVILSFANFFAAKEFSDVMDNKNEDAYVSIQRAAFWDKTQRAMFSLSQALVFVKTWKLLMFTDKTFLSFALTVKLTSGYMAAFVLMLIIMICAFAFSGYFLFAEDLWEFSSWGEGMISLVDQILGVTLFDEFTTAKPMIGRVYSFSFGFFIVFVFLNFIVALLDLGVHEAKEVVQQRRVWLTFAQYFTRILYRTFPTLNRKHRKMKMAAEMRTLPPERVHAMKTVLAEQLRDFLEVSGYNTMQEMKEHSNKILAGTGFKVVSRKEKKERENFETVRHMEHMKEIAIAIFREKLGHEMKPEEFKEYADFNRAYVKLRIKKMERKIGELEGKMDLFVDKIMKEMEKK